MGVHTGDSVTVAPQMTLADEAYQELRDAAAAVIRAVGVDTGGSNIQFARSRETGEVRVIEMNPRVSRSSALASKATGYPIAKVAAKLAVGYTLDEIPNDLTGTTPASFEPTLDYVVVKFPRFAFEKFPGADRTLGTQMKSVGETMGIGRTFAEAFQKAMRSRELDTGAATPWQTLADVPDDVHPFFVERSGASRRRCSSVADADVDEVPRRRLAAAEAPRHLRRRHRGSRRRRPSRSSAHGGVSAASAPCTGASTRAPARWRRRRTTTTRPGARRKRRRRRARSPASSSSAPARTASARGSSSTTAACMPCATFRELGYEAVMVNCNPETVSTDYDTSDRLYFEPLDAESVLAVCDRERPEGVVIQFGGQTPLKLARAIEEAGYRILGTPYDAVDLAEDRERFAGLLRAHDIRSPGWGMASSSDEAVEVANEVGYPVLDPPLVRARRPGDARLLHRRRGARGSRARAGARRPLPRGRGRDRRRRALRRVRHVRRRRDAARRGGRRPLGRLRRACCRRRGCHRHSRRRFRRPCGRSAAPSASSASSTSSSRSPRTARSTSSRRTRARRARCRS